MADVKFTALAEDTAPTFDDLVCTVNDPAGTPASKKAKLVNVTGSPVNAQTGTSYTILTGDYRKLVTFTNAAAIAVTLPQAGASFPANWYCFVQNRGAGTATVTPTTSTIDGAASLALATGQGCVIISDGTNYFTMRGGAGASTAPGGPPTGSAGGDLTGTYPNPTINSGAVTVAKLATAAKTTTLVFIIDGGGSAITTGVKGDLVVDFACAIQSVTLLADQSGSIVVDIWKDSYANYPPVVGDSITASAKPTISAATKSQDSTLTGWTTSVSAGDILRFNVDSITTCQRVTVALKVVLS